MPCCVPTGATCPGQHSFSPEVLSLAHLLALPCASPRINGMLLPLELTTDGEAMGKSLLLHGIHTASFRYWRTSTLIAGLSTDRDGHPTRSSAERSSTRRSARREASTFRTYAWWIDRRAGSARRARQRGLCLRPLPGRRDDALREQRHRTLAGIRATAGTPAGVNTDHPATSTIVSVRYCQLPPPRVACLMTSH